MEVSSVTHTSQTRLGRLGMLVGVVTVAAIAAAAVIIARSGEHVPISHRNAWAGGASALGYALAGAALARRRPRNAVAWILLVMGACNAIGVVGDAWARYALAGTTGTPDSAVWAAWVSSWVWVPGFMPLVAVVLPVYPSGRAEGWRRRLAYSGVGGVSAFAGAVALAPTAVSDVVPGLSNPVGAAAASGVLAAVGGATLVACAVAALVDAARRLGRSRSPQREQLAWMFLALTVQVPAVMANAVLAVPVVFLVPLAIAVGVARHRLFDLQIIVRRALVYAVLTACVVASFATAAAVTGSALDLSFSATMFAALIAVALTPLRDRLQRAADRVVYGYTRDPVGAVTALGRRIEELPSADIVVSTLHAVADALRAPGVAVVDMHGGVLAAVGSQAVARPAEHFTLMSQGQAVGQLVVSARAGSDVWSPADRAVMDALAPQVALVVQAARLNDELVRSRDLVVGATYEERQRLRDELHDGLGPALSGIALGLEAAEHSVGGEHPVAGLVRRLREETQSAASEVRRLVHGLGPGSVEELGLRRALEIHAAAVRERAGLQLLVDIAPEVAAVPVALQAAAYRITMEAITNVVRHSAARSCRVCVDIAESELTIAVHDDGIGLTGAALSTGVGLQSMRRRSEEFGGSLEMAGRPGGGTSVLVRMPLEQPCRR